MTTVIRLALIEEPLAALFKDDWYRGITFSVIYIGWFTVNTKVWTIEVISIVIPKILVIFSTPYAIGTATIKPTVTSIKLSILN